MSRPAVLNPKESVSTIDPVELSGQLLGALRSVHASGERGAVADLAGGLNGSDPAAIEGDSARLAFWLNVYNALLLHRLSVKPAGGSMLMHPLIFSACAYLVGGAPFTLNQIEHGVLRRNRRPPLHPRRPFRRSDPRMRSLPSRVDPRIHFALNCGARSCPPIRIYDARNLDHDLRDATRAYLEAETEIDPAGVKLPRLMRLYAGDFGSRSEQITFASAHLPELAALQAGRGEGLRVRYGRFDWTAAPIREAADYGVTKQ